MPASIPESPAQRFKPLRQGLPLMIANGRGKADVVKLAFIVVKAEPKRADLARIRCIPKTSDHAVGGAPALGVSAASFRTRDTAGSRRSCEASNDSVSPTGIAISPSTTNQAPKTVPFGLELPAAPRGNSSTSLASLGGLVRGAANRVGPFLVTGFQRQCHVGVPQKSQNCHQSL